MVSSIGATAATTQNDQTTNAAAAIQGNLGQDAFLKLLVEELKQQDPLQPKDDKSFIAELAQFSSVEQMTELNKKFETMMTAFNTTSVVSVLGKQVNGIDSDGNAVSGVANKIRYEDGKPFITLNDENNQVFEIPIENITQVTQADQTT